MKLRHVAAVGLSLAILAATAGCQGSVTAEPSPSVPGATSYLEFRDAFCSAWEDLFRGIGNPDTGSDSELSAAMDDAIAAGDRAEVDRLAGEIIRALESGRGNLRVAGGWSPGSSVALAMDPIFVTFEKMIEAKRAAAPQGLDEATRIAQGAFEAAGGMDAWVNGLRSMQNEEVMRVIASARPAGLDPQCENVPIGI
jgi:hypothetical protein